MATVPLTAEDLRSHVDELERLDERSLMWWVDRVDARHGGFLLDVSEKQLATQSRMVWVFAHAARHGRGDYLAAAEQGVAFLLDRFRDRRHGGFFWTTGRQGDARDPRKILYGHVFLVYGLVEYWRASGDRRALDEANAVFNLLAERAHDRQYGGWFEHCAPDWRPLPPSPPNWDIELPGLKSANAHLHVVEALTELGAATGDAAVMAALAETVDVCTNHFFPPDPSEAALHRTRDWRPAGQPEVSSGHNIEFAWLVTRAESVLGREPSPQRLERYVMHALAALAGDRVWWVSAELVAGLTVACQRGVTGPEPLAAFLGTLLETQIDPADGVWIHTVASDGSVLDPTKVGTWKDAFHEVRAVSLLRRAVAGDRPPYP